jgi:hypothetical protein
VSSAIEKSEPPHGPHDIGLEQHAHIAAALAEGTRSQAQVLESFRISEAQWNESTAHWMNALAEDAKKNGVEARLAILYSNAFSAAQDAAAPVPPMTPEEWAQLTVEVQLEGGPGQPLARRNLSLADYLRLVRHFAKRLSSDPDEDRRFFERLLALQPPEP